mmetsp:Transcript_56683/g.156891  ORF Transcript_56683/g.156891 Transcript_56683/m.156891 type:complete len:250 (-) Transcript_56683:127-876(-)
MRGLLRLWSRRGATARRSPTVALVHPRRAALGPPPSLAGQRRHTVLRRREPVGAALAHRRGRRARRRLFARRRLLILLLLLRRLRLCRCPLLLLLHHVEEGVTQETLEKLLKLLLRKHTIVICVGGLEKRPQAALPRRLQAKVFVECVGQAQDFRPLQNAIAVHIMLAEHFLAGVAEHHGAAKQRPHVLGIVGVDRSHCRAAQIPQGRSSLPCMAVVLSQDVHHAIWREAWEALAEPVEDFLPLFLAWP